MEFQRLDKVKYLDETVYIHHLSEEGFTPTAWLYGVSSNRKRLASIYTHEPASLKLIAHLGRCTDYSEWLNGDVGIDWLLFEDKQELLNVCIKNGIDISNADPDSYYKNLWFISNNQLKTVQTVAEAKEQKVCKIYEDILKYIYEHEK